MAFLLPVVFSPSVNAVYWTPAAALLIVVVGIGLPRLFWHAWARSLPHVLAAAFLAWAGLSALLSRNVVLSVVGLYGWGTGWLFLAAIVSAFAIGTDLDRHAVQLVTRALLGGALVNAVIALAQTVTDLTVFNLGLYSGRAQGTLGNPVHLAVLLAAALAFTHELVDRSWRLVWMPALLAAGIELSGSRSGVVAVVVVLVWSVARNRRVGAVVVAAVIVGFALGGAAAAVGAGVNDTATSRIQGAAATGGLTPRIAMWDASVSALWDRPLTGWGPGQFRSATSSYRTLRMAHAEGSDVLYTDAHNVVVEYATTTGVVGLALAVAWILAAARRARGGLAMFATAMLVGHLFEPEWIRTTPLALLALGAATPRLATLRRPRVLVVSAVAAATAASIAASILLIGDFHLDQGRLDFAPYHAQRAIELLPSWPEPATLEARIHLFAERTTRDPAELDAAVTWRRRAVARDDTDPSLWNALGETELFAAHPTRAMVAFDRALDFDPVSARALNGVGYAQAALGEDARALAAFRRSLEINPAQRRIKAVVDDLRSKTR